MAMRKRELTVMHPNAAGIDIGSASHYVAAAPDQSEEPVKEFGCFTEDIEPVEGRAALFGAAHGSTGSDGTT